ncbi:hypothetical protein D3C80_1127280 [compost metagenome]
MQGDQQFLLSGAVDPLQGFFLQHLSDTFGTGLEVQAQRALDGDTAVTEGLNGEYLALRALLEATIQTHQLADLILGDVLAFAAEGFSHLGIMLAAVDQLHLALTRGNFVVAEYPHIGGNSGVVEHVRRQRDDGFDQVVLQ